MSRPLIGILKTGSTSLTATRRRRGGDYDVWFREALRDEEVDCEVVDAVVGPLPESVPWDGLIITGSPASVHHRAPWSEAAAAWVAARIAEGLPTLGVCYGHQLIAHALGGEAVPNPHGPEVGTYRVELLQSDPLFDGLDGASFCAHLIHYDAVTRLPNGARTLARSPLCDVQAFAIGDHVRAVQWHPEFDAIGTREAVLKDAHILAAAGQDPEALAEAVRPLPYRERILTNFVRNFVRATR